MALALVMTRDAGAVTNPNDTYFASQWALQKIRGPQAWDLSTGSPTVRVAVVSTGVQTNHPDLAGNLVPGYNAISPGTPYNDLQGQGTMMSGIIGAVGNNATMITGVSWRVSIIPVRGCDTQCTVTGVSNGIHWAADANADVIVVGAAFSATSPELSGAISYAVNSGAIIIAASGDVAGAPVLYPAAYSPVIAVAATDSSDAVGSFSSRGPALDLTAPGVSISSTWPGSQVSTGSGTHLAAAHVGGVAALLLARGVPAAQVRNALQQGSQDLGTAGWDSTYGSGRLDACGAFSAAGIACPVGSATATPTRTPTHTPTRTNTPSAGSPTATNTPTRTPTRTNTPAAGTPTWTSTPTRTPTRTNTPTRTPTFTNTPTRTPTRTSTPSPTPTPDCPPGHVKNGHCT